MAEEKKLEVRAETTEEVMVETTEEVRAETTEEVRAETTEEVRVETTEEVMVETMEEVRAETMEEVRGEIEANNNNNPLIILEKNKCIKTQYMDIKLKQVAKLLNNRYRTMAPRLAYELLENKSLF